MIVRSDNNIAYDNVMTPIYNDRVIADGGTIETLTEVEEVLSDLGDQDVVPSLLWVAEGSKVGKDYSILPNDGSGDFSVTRPGDTAFTQNPDLTWRPALPNEPRFTYINGVKGRLVESAATRLNADPYSIEKPSWTKSGVMVEGDPATAGSELVVNGGFDVDANWLKVNNVQILGGKAIFNTSDGTPILFQIINCNVGDLIKIDVTITDLTSGVLRLRGNTPYISQTLVIGSAVGSYTYYIINEFIANPRLGFETTGNISIDNVSAKVVSGFDCPFVDANGINTKQGRKLVATANNGSIKLATPVAVTAATSYVNSVYTKRLVGTGTIYIVDVNNTDRAVTVTSEWTLVQYAAAASGTTGQLGIKMATAGDEVMVCYMPIEVGTAATSPIGGAEGATQTRNADAVAKTGASALIGQTEGTYIIEFEVNNLTNDVTYIDLQGVNVANRIFLRKSTNLLVGQCQVTAGVQASIIKNPITIGRYKAAFAYKENDFAFAVNGELVGIDTVGVLPAMTKIWIGGRADGASYINSTINYAVISKTRLSNAQLQQLTTL